MISYQKNLIHPKFIVYLSLFISLGLLLFCLQALALTCPGPQGFQHKENVFGGWSWELRPEQRSLGFSSEISSSVFASPSEKDFSPTYPLMAGIYFIHVDTAKNRATARLYCDYTLADGELFSVSTNEKDFSTSELTRIANTWEKRTRRFYEAEYMWVKSGYECTTTAGAADKCNIDFT